MYNTCPTCTNETPCLCNKTQRIGPPQAPKSEGLEEIIIDLTKRIETLEKFVAELSSKDFKRSIDHLKFR